ncbi:MAG TPA: MFS transporter [Acidimicrobiales bacterium]|jgi:EmrB/QacA subfamily drug resistance transporter|nr:MFS transporter [Acidimicrobiales bacterium]
MDAETIHNRRWWTLLVLCLSLTMVIVGNTTLNVALPTLIRDLHASTTELQWMVDAYGLVFAGLLLTSGALGDRFGRKGALQAGLVIFGLGSLAAGLSHSPAQIILCRAVMGVGASLVMPATLSILTNVFPPHERSRAIGAWAGVAAAGAAFGPIVSGWLLAHFWWGSVFFVNMPIVLLAIVGGLLLVPTSRDPRQPPLDLVGAGMSIVGLSALLYGIIEAPNRGWLSTDSLLAFGVAALFIGLFAWWELRSREPMLDLRYFKNGSFSGGALAITFAFFAMFGLFFLLTQYFQLVLGYTPLEAGVRLLPMAATIMVTAPSSARLAERFGSRNVVVTGLSIIALGLVLISRFGVHTTYAQLILSLMITAVGMGLTSAPSTTSIMSSLPLGKAGVGSAVNDTTRELGGALGVAVLGSLVASHYQSTLKPVLAPLPSIGKSLAFSSLGGALEQAQRLGGQAGEAMALGARTAFVHAMSQAALIGAVVAAVASIAVYRLLPDRLDAPAHDLAHAHGDDLPVPEPAL